ncbi:MAG: putative RNA uridine N3 methyltransferase [Caldivirga sp.]|jgi:predicted SPOUT superfamily RNA methylase MTH1
MGINIAIPYNVTEEATTEEEAVRKIGYIGRAAAIFRVKNVYIYTFKGSEEPRRALFIKKNLEYLVTPPYLRKDLFGLDPDLRLAGLLQPLNLPVFGHRRGDVKVHEVRVGLVIRWDGYYSVVKIGDEMYVKVPKPYPIKSLVAVSIDSVIDGKFYRGHVVKNANVYTGYTVSIVKLGELVGMGNLILTGKEGKSIISVMNELRGLINKSGDITVVFGSPRMGVDEILKSEGLGDVLRRSLFVNFIPNQGLVTVRTEEAIVAVLSILNVIGSIPQPSGEGNL